MVGGKRSFIDSALQPLGDEQILDGFSVSWVAGKNLWEKELVCFEIIVIDHNRVVDLNNPSFGNSKLQAIFILSCYFFHTDKT